MLDPIWSSNAAQQCLLLLLHLAMQAFDVVYCDLTLISFRQTVIHRPRSGHEPISVVARRHVTRTCHAFLLAFCPVLPTLLASSTITSFYTFATNCNPVLQARDDFYRASSCKARCIYAITGVACRPYLEFEEELIRPFWKFSCRRSWMFPGRYFWIRIINCFLIFSIIYALSLCLSIFIFVCVCVFCYLLMGHVACNNGIDWLISYILADF